MLPVTFSVLALLPLEEVGATEPVVEARDADEVSSAESLLPVPAVVVMVGSEVGVSEATGVVGVLPATLVPAVEALEEAAGAVADVGSADAEVVGAAVMVAVVVAATEVSVPAALVEEGEALTAVLRVLLVVVELWVPMVVEEVTPTV